MNELNAEIIIKDNRGHVVGRTTANESAQFLETDGTVKHEFLLHFSVEEKRGTK
jgi:hypothetical protein